MSRDAALSFNGINGSTGDYLTRYSEDELVALITGDRPTGAMQFVLEAREALGEKHFGPAESVEDSADLAQAGWGIIFGSKDKAQVPAIKEALKPLLDLRRAQAGGSYAEGGFYAEFDEDDQRGWVGLQAGDNLSAWLALHGTANGQPVDPADGVPYYLLLVGDPESIPFSFQYELSVQFAVGRLFFDNPNDYAQYAVNVVATEAEAFQVSRSATFFGAANEDDPATLASAKQLVKPLASSLKKSKAADGWKIKSLIGDGKATKANLVDLMGGDKTPGLLFTATHGIGFELDDARLLPHQGALMCQEWPGRSWGGRVPEAFYVAADDIPSDANMLGSIAFHFACYSAGTPKFDDFAKVGRKPKQKAPQSLLAKLPSRLLRQGAVAAVGHVDLAWTYSFVENRKPQLGVFKSPLEAMMKGKRVGHALEFIDDRWAALATQMVTLQRELQFGAKIAPQVARKWTALADARNYVLIGDPAVRLRVADSADSTPKPKLPAVVVPVVDGGNSAETKNRLQADVDRLRSAITRLIDTLNNTVTDVTSDLTKIEVKTYVADELEQVQFENGQVIDDATLKLAAHTHIAFGGDQTTVVSSDGALWEHHQQSVAQAQAHRVELLKAMLAVVSNEQDDVIE